MKLLALGACLLASCCTVTSLRMAATSNVWQLHNEFTHYSASGVPIAIHDGELWILTAKHVPVATAAQGWVAKHRSGILLGKGRVVSMHDSEDAAIMAFALGDHEPFIAELDFAPLEIGEKVYGAGWGGGHYLWLTLGLVSGANRMTTQIASGDSGGGLFNEQGELIGILVGRYAQYDAHMAHVVPLAAIEEWLRAQLGLPKAYTPTYDSGWMSMHR